MLENAASKHPFDVGASVFHLLAAIRKRDYSKLERLVIKNGKELLAVTDQMDNTFVHVVTNLIEETLNEIESDDEIEIDDEIESDDETPIIDQSSSPFLHRVSIVFLCLCCILISLKK